MDETTLEIPVFVSCPGSLTSDQQAFVRMLQDECRKRDLHWQRVEAAHYSIQSPLAAVLDIIKGSYGGLVLGFEHFRAESGVIRPHHASERTVSMHVTASPWQQIEAAALLSRNLPVLILKDRGVQGGIFDIGTSNNMVLTIPGPGDGDDRLAEPLSWWAGEVRGFYEKSNSVFDVFLSFSGEDELPAREVFEFLAQQGLRVFFSRESIPQLAQSDYMKAINTAVDRARHMIVVSSTAEGFAKPWVEREWTMFLNEKLSGRKSGNLVVAPVKPIPVGRLPIALRSQQMVDLSSNGLREIQKFVQDPA